MNIANPANRSSTVGRRFRILPRGIAASMSDAISEAQAGDTIVCPDEAAVARVRAGLARRGKGGVRVEIQD